MHLAKPRTLQEATASLLNTVVAKEFPPHGYFEGSILDIRDHYTLKLNGPLIQVSPPDNFLYDIKYDDGDGESVEWDELVQILKWPLELRPAPQETASPGADNENNPPTSSITEASAGERQPQPTRQKRRLASDADNQLGTEADQHAADLAHTLQPSTSKQQSQSKRSRTTGGNLQARMQRVLAEQNINVQDAIAGAGPSRLARPGHAPQGNGQPVPMEGVEDVDEASHDKFRKTGLPGHIMRIVLKDFMCHQHLELEFGPHVTLITGSNGSGKSAVLQALQTCLGVSARNTGRGTQLAGFIRQGSDLAECQVTLFNEGDEAYKPNEYGKKIVIERKIRRSGGGEYRVYGDAGRNGRGSSAKREDVDAVLDHFSINAGNPLTIITQDMARAFHAGNAKDKQYKFEKYMQGTMLDETQCSIKGSQVLLDKALVSIRQGEEDCRVLEAQLQQLQQELAKMQDLEKLREDLNHIENVAAWQRVADEKQEMADLERAVQEWEQRLPLLQQKVQDDKAALGAAEELVQVKNASLNRAVEEGQQMQHVLGQLRNHHKSIRQHRVNFEKELRDVANALQDLRAQKQDFETQLTQTENTQVDTEKIAEARRRLAEFGELIKVRNDAIMELDKELAIFRQRTDENEQQRQALCEERDNCTNRARHQGEEVVNLRQQLEGMRTETNRAAMFGGEQVARLQHLISQHRFQHPPIGPIGAYLTLTDPKWNLATEGVLGNLMTKFICFNKDDLIVINRMASKLNMRNVGAFVVKPNMPRHNVRTNAPQGCTMLIDVLRVNHPEPSVQDAIFNTLVDRGRIENSILVEGQGQGRDLAYDPSFRGFNIVEANGWSFRMLGRGTVATNPYKGTNMPRVGSDMSAMRMHLEQQLQHAERELEGLNARVQQITAELADLHQQYKALNKDSANIVIKRKNLRAALQDIERQQAHVAAGTVNQDASEEEQRINAATQMITRCHLDIAEAEAELARLTQELEQARAKEAEAAQALQDKMASSMQENYLTELNQEIHQLGAKVEAAKKTLLHSKENLAAAEGERRQKKEKLTQMEANHPKTLETAELFCTPEACEQSRVIVRQYLQRKYAAQPRGQGRSKRKQPASNGGGSSGAQADDEEEQAWIEAAMTYDALETQGRAITSELEAAERSAGGNKDELEIEVEKQGKRCIKKRALQDLVSSNVRNLRSSYNQRARKFDTMQTLVRTNCNRAFAKLMKRRGHIGELVVDYVNSTLSVKVKVNHDKDPKTKWVEDLKQLSGGERSYTTVCLLLAMAEYCEFPFHCLDEYDVFMDAIIRRIATERLLAFGADHKNRQIILLTPQDISMVNEAKQQVEKDSKQGAFPEDFIKTLHMRPARPANQ